MKSSNKHRQFPDPAIMSWHVMTVHRAWHHAEATWHAPSLRLVHRGGWRRPPLGPLCMDTSRWPKCFETSHFTYRKKILENPWTNTGMTNIQVLLYIKMLEYKIHVCVLLGLKFGLIPWKCAGGQGFLAGSRSGRDEAQLTDCLTWIGMCRAWRAKMISSDLLRLWLQREKKKLPRRHGNTFD